MDTTTPRRRFESLRSLLVEYRRPLLTVAGGAAVVALVLAIVPQVLGFGDTLKRVRQGNKSWLLLAVVFEALSLAGYVALFRSVFSSEDHGIRWRTSYQITLAGTVATKVLAAGGAGGIALTAWALRAAGLDGRTITRRMASFQVLLYAVYMGALLITGAGLATHEIPGGGPVTLTLAPAAFAAFMILLVLGVALHHRPAAAAEPPRRLAPAPLRHVREGLSVVSRTACEGVRTSARLLTHPRPGHLGAVAYWAFDIATLWASFRAFGVAPRVAVLVMGYFVGLLANAIPLPGGIGGVEGGMIGCFAAFGIDAAAALVAVLTYRAVSFWLPTIPGILAYVQLRRAVARRRSDGPPTDLTMKAAAPAKPA
jgi:uncharacterized membrane protein YbhN (UPF0104 family)